MDFEPQFINDINNRYPLGKGEVVSSILTGSTIYRGLFGSIRQFDTERYENTTSPTAENPWTLFGGCSRLRAHLVPNEVPNAKLLNYLGGKSRISVNRTRTDTGSCARAQI